MKIVHKKRTIIFLVLICIVTIVCCLYKSTLKKKIVLNSSDEYLFFLTNSNKANKRNLTSYNLNKDNPIVLAELLYTSANITYDSKKVYITVPTTYIENNKLDSKVYIYDMETGCINSMRMEIDSIKSFYIANKLITYGEKDGDLYLAVGQDKKIEYLKVKDNFKAFTAAVLNDNLYLTSKDLVIKYDLKSNKIVKEFPLGKVYNDVIIAVKEQEILLAGSKGSAEILSLTNDLDIKNRYELPGVVIDMIVGKEAVLINSVNIQNDETTLYAMKDKVISKIKFDKTLKICYRGVYYVDKQQFLLPYGNAIINLNENDLTIKENKIENGPCSNLYLKYSGK